MKQIKWSTQHFQPNWSKSYYDHQVAMRWKWFHTTPMRKSPQKILKRKKKSNQNHLGLYIYIYDFLTQLSPKSNFLFISVKQTKMWREKIGGPWSLSGPRKGGGEQNEKKRKMKRKTEKKKKIKMEDGHFFFVAPFSPLRSWRNYRWPGKKGWREGTNCLLFSPPLLNNSNLKRKKKEREKKNWPK